MSVWAIVVFLTGIAWPVSPTWSWKSVGLNLSAATNGVSAVIPGEILSSHDASDFSELESAAESMSELISSGTTITLN